MSIAIIAIGLAIGSVTAPTGFQYITADEGALRSTHDIRVEVRAPSGYRLLAPTSRNADFDGRPFEVSLAALAGRNTAVMFHAERVADGSGASNYDELPESPWKGFRIRSQCVTVAAADVAEEHDLKWLSDRGWSPAGNIALEQHFRTTADHNQEIVISLMAKVPSCSDKPAVESALKRLRSAVRVRPI